MPPAKLTWHGGGHAAAQQLEGVVGDLVGGRALGGVGARGHHSGLQQDTLQQHLETQKQTWVQFANKKSVNLS